MPDLTKHCCIRCKRQTAAPVIVESRDHYGRAVFRAVFCNCCHWQMVEEQEGNDRD